MQDLAVDNFRAAICRALSQPKPNECSHLPGSATGNAAILPMIITSALFVLLAKWF